jgi:hypothetical protein
MSCREAEKRPHAEPASGLRASLDYRPLPQPDLCALSIEKLEHEEELPGAPELQKHRAHILARARATPVIFHTKPQPPIAVSEQVLKLRRLLLVKEDPADAILEVLRKTRNDLPLRRQVFLTDSYLYADHPLLALRLSQILRLDHLFSKEDKKVVIERGTDTIMVTRQEGNYFLPAIADANPKKKHHMRLASLLLFDRVRTASEEFGPPLHVDVRELQTQMGFSSAEIRKITRDRMALDLNTYGVKSQAIITWEGAVARLECETTEPGAREDLAVARAALKRDRALVEPVLAAAHEIIFRQLPFDEPKTEEGQQDGFLRMYFKQAYEQYGSTYEFNGDSYYVFDGYGRVRLPQVCIDFITDAFDWGTGGHWPDRGSPRVYKKGALHFASLGMENPRSVENLAAFATEHPDWFDVRWLPKSEQVKFRHREKFFAALEREAELYRPGDIVFILGLRDDDKFHYHSFIIDEKDPLTGMPMVLLANAGPPQARSWEGEMQNAPLRSIVARVRVRPEILERAYEQARHSPGVPLTLPEQLVADASAEGDSPSTAEGGKDG